MNIQTSPYLSAVRKPDTYQGRTEHADGAQGISFGSILTEKMEQSAGAGVKFSKHATSRLTQRGISLSQEQLSRLAEGMDKASGKGMKEPLVLIDDLAFIVSTDKKTVITAVGQQQTKDNVFTNIDGAVIN